MQVLAGGLKEGNGADMGTWATRNRVGVGSVVASTRRLISVGTTMILPLQLRRCGRAGRYVTSRDNGHGEERKRWRGEGTRMKKSLDLLRMRVAKACWIRHHVFRGIFRITRIMMI